MISAPVTEAGSAAANKTAIDAALSAAAAAGGGWVLIPAGEFLTNGGHDVPPRVTVLGVGQNATQLIHRGATYCFRLMDDSPGQVAGVGLRDLSIQGSTGELPPVSGGIGVEISNGLAARLSDVWISGFTENGIGLYFHNIDGALEYVEQARVQNVAIINCKRLIRFYSEAAGGTSFGYNRLRGMQLQVYDDQTALSMGTGTLYNCWIEGTLHYAGDDAIGIDVDATGEIFQGTKLDIRGELLASHTGCTRVKSAGKFDAAGKFYIANGQPPDNHVGGHWCFVEENPTTAELAQTGNLTVASATTLVLPARGAIFDVTGNTAIQAIGGPVAWEGRVVTLRFTEAITITDTFNLRLAGGFNATADDTLTLGHRSGTWYEISRSAN